MMKSNTLNYHNFIESIVSVAIEITKRISESEEMKRAVSDIGYAFDSIRSELLKDLEKLECFTSGSAGQIVFLEQLESCQKEYLKWAEDTFTDFELNEITIAIGYIEFYRRLGEGEEIEDLKFICSQWIEDFKIKFENKKLQLIEKPLIMIREGRLNLIDLKLSDDSNDLKKLDKSILSNIGKTLVWYYERKNNQRPEKKIIQERFNDYAYKIICAIRDQDTGKHNNHKGYIKEIHFEEIEAFIPSLRKSEYDQDRKRLFSN